LEQRKFTAASGKESRGVIAERASFKNSFGISISIIFLLTRNQKIYYHESRFNRRGKAYNHRLKAIEKEVKPIIVKTLGLEVETMK